MPMLEALKHRRRQQKFREWHKTCATRLSFLLDVATVIEQAATSRAFRNTRAVPAASLQTRRSRSSFVSCSVPGTEHRENMAWFAEALFLANRLAPASFSARRRSTEYGVLRA